MLAQHRLVSLIKFLVFCFWVMSVIARYFSVFTIFADLPAKQVPSRSHTFSSTEKLKSNIQSNIYFYTDELVISIFLRLFAKLL